MGGQIGVPWRLVALGDAAQLAGDVEAARARSHHVEIKRFGSVLELQAVHRPLHLIAHGGEDHVVDLLADGVGERLVLLIIYRCLEDRRHEVALLRTLGLYLTDKDGGRAGGHGHPSRLGATAAGEHGGAVACCLNMGEHRQRGADEAHATHEFVGLAVDKDAVDLYGRDIERVDASAFARHRVAARHRAEEIAVGLALTLGLADEHGAQLGVGIGLGGLHDEVGLPADSIVFQVSASVAVALGETVDGLAAHEEGAQHTVHDIVDAAGLHALVVVAVAAVHVHAGIVAQRRIAIDVESGGQHLLADHVLEGLAAFLEAVALQTMTEDLMEEDAGSRPREDGRAGIGIGDGSSLQGLHTFEQVLRSGDEPLLGGQRVGVESKEILHHRQHHAVVGHGLGDDEDTRRAPVLHHLGAVGVDEIGAVDLIDQCRCAVLKGGISLEHGTHGVEPFDPLLVVELDSGGVERRFIVVLGRCFGEARSLVLVGGRCGGLALGVLVCLHGTVVGSHCGLPEVGGDAVGGIVVKGQCGSLLASTVGIVLVVVKCHGTYAHLRDKRAHVAVVVAVEHAEGTGDRACVVVLHAIAHEIGLHRLFLQFGEVVFQPVTKEREQLVLLLCRGCEGVEAEQ